MACVRWRWMKMGICHLASLPRCRFAAKEVACPALEDNWLTLNGIVKAECGGVWRLKKTLCEKMSIVWFDIVNKLSESLKRSLKKSDVDLSEKASETDAIPKLASKCRALMSLTSVSKAETSLMTPKAKRLNKTLRALERNKCRLCNLPTFFYLKKHFKAGNPTIYDWLLSRTQPDLHSSSTPSRRLGS